MNQTPSKARSFTIGIFQPLTKANNAEFIIKSIPALCENGLNIICMAEGDNDIMREMLKLSEQYDKQITVLERNEANQKKLFSKSIVALFPGNTDKNILKKTMKEGIVPIVSHDSGLESFNAQQESGYAFTFKKGNFHQFLFAIQRASINHEFSYDWNTIKKAMIHS